ncbi:YncE family protein [Henriciella sp.]|uniref:YncE family protein n=1 Tax=Henriciella sp. TaxID=1968823 RepID=UPI0026273251|nr:YncE family protein [Henriciella sp.]
MIRLSRPSIVIGAACLGAIALGLVSIVFSGNGKSARAAAAPVNTGSFEREGLKVDFAIASVANDEGRVIEGEMARVSFTITDAETGEPVSGLYPAAWVDPINGRDELTAAQCRQKAGLYLSGYIGVRPMVDLNSYYVVVLNDDPTIAVIDPIIGVKGITKLLTQIILPARGADWTPSADQKRVFVAMPDTNSVAVVDLDTFRLETTIKVGDHPDRITTQPDGRYVWVGRTGDKPGVSVIDTTTLKRVADIETGDGHHEITVTADNRFAYVTNRKSRTVSVIDVRELKKIEDISLDGAPIAVAYSPLAEAVYVADGVNGTVTAIDPETRQPRGTITLEAGLGPMKITPDGRYGFVTNAAKDAVFIFDTATNGLVHRVAIEGKPFQVVFSRNFAFIRALDTPRVSMIKLTQIGGPEAPAVLGYAAGERAPAESPSLLPADMFAPAVTEAATLTVSPGDATVYYYMEGMNAPMGNFRNYGHRPLAALVADRTIKEVAPGEYVSLVKMPAPGEFGVIMTMDSPQIIECFGFTSEQNPQLVADELPLRIAYDTRSGKLVETGQDVSVQFTLSDTAKEGAPYTGDDVTAVTYRAPGDARLTQAAEHLGNGRYQVRLTPGKAGVYYVYPAVRSKGLGFSKLPFITVIARDGAGPAAGGAR